MVVRTKRFEHYEPPPPLEQHLRDELELIATVERYVASGEISEQAATALQKGIASLANEALVLKLKCDLFQRRMRQMQQHRLETLAELERMKYLQRTTA